MARVPRGEARRIAELFGVDTGSLDVGRSGPAAFYALDLGLPAATYVVDSPEGAEIASKPELVGDRLKEKAAAAAAYAVKLMESLGLGERAVLLHILRGSPGYEITGPLEKAAEVDNIYIRVMYSGDSYRNHVEREARAVYTKAGQIASGRYTLVVADTVATGRSMLEALGRALDVLRFKSVEIDRVYVYGFLSLPGAARVAGALASRGLDAVLIAVEDYSALSRNEYDMPLYGPDPAEPSKLLGGAAPLSALERMLPMYYPGMDQPGDWSERQCRLFNGVGYERGDTEGHLRRSLEMLEELHSVASGEDWYRGWMEEVYGERRRGLLSALESRVCE